MEFCLPERRFQKLYDSNGILVVDDYAHHPTEIKAALSILSGSEYKRVIAVFQPHRYTRLKLLMKEFAESFDVVDKLIIAKLYSANQKEIKDVNSGRLTELVKSYGIKDVIYIEDFDEIAKYLLSIVKKSDAIIFLSAGNLTKTAHEFGNSLRERIK